MKLLRPYIAKTQSLFNGNPSVRLPKYLAEIVIIIVWGIWIGNPYWNLDASLVPAGGEFFMGAQSHYVWRLFQECGFCFAWNGFSNGGVPSFAEVHGAWLHPLVAIPTLLLGVISGAKIAVVLCLIMAGLAQLWLGRMLGVGVIPRMWGALLVTSAGHLAGKMQNGLVPLVVSTAACSLVLPAAINLAQNGRRRNAILLAITVALALLSGQGYLQIGMVFSVLPALLFLLVSKGGHMTARWKEFVFAGLLALLLVSFFLVPLLTFGGNLGKDIDTGFRSAQPLIFAPLNLVINDPDLYYTNALQKQPYPYLYVNYIGWIPVFLALIALPQFIHEQRRLTLFFVFAIFLIFVAGSAIPFKLLDLIWPGSAVGIRNPSIISGLAVPLIVGLSSIGLDQIFKQRGFWLLFSTSPDAQSDYRFKLNIKWFWMIPLFWSLVQTTQFGRNWIYTDPVDVESLALLTESLKTSSVEWVEPPFGEHFWLPAAMNANLKMANYFRPWHWKKRALPTPYLEAFRSEPFPEGRKLVGTVKGIFIVKSEESRYASVITLAGNNPCQAQSRGGTIDVNCVTDQSGLLVVQEHQWQGWYAWVDGRATSLREGANWLTIDLPAGKHHIEFRYIPSDLIIGIILSFIGISAAIWLWRNDSHTFQTVENAQST